MSANVHSVLMQASKFLTGFFFQIFNLTKGQKMYSKLYAKSAMKNLMDLKQNFARSQSLIFNIATFSHPELDG
jgi:hypothetical protein